VLKTAPHREAAIKFLEYLVSDEAQTYFAAGNNEWPVVAGLASKNRALETLGTFKFDQLPVSRLLENAATAQRVNDRAGWR
jgi:iron(III) transport system substrate-binding protein